MKQICNRKLIPIIFLSITIFTVSCGGLLNSQPKSEAKIQVMNFPDFEESDLLKMEFGLLNYRLLSEVIEKYDLDKANQTNDEITQKDMDKLREKTSVKLTDKSKSVFTISYSNDDPKKARDITAEIATRFVKLDVENSDTKSTRNESKTEDKKEKAEAQIISKPTLRIIDPPNLPIA